MAVSVQIKVIKNEFPAASGKMASAIGTAFQALGPELLSTMQGKTPVDTGRLRASEQASVGSKELRLSASTDYAGYVEFGTRKMAAQPYMRPTVDGAGGQVAAAVADAASSAFGE